MIPLLLGGWFVRLGNEKLREELIARHAPKFKVTHKVAAVNISFIPLVRDATSDTCSLMAPLLLAITCDCSYGHQMVEDLLLADGLTDAYVHFTQHAILSIGFLNIVFCSIGLRPRMQLVFHLIT